MLDAYIDSKLESFLERIIAAMPAAPHVPDGVDLGIVPGHVYTQKQVAKFLQSTPGVVSRIPEYELPRVRRIGSSVGYYGMNVLCYMHKLPPVDTELITQQFRERLMDERPSKIKPLQRTGKTRIQ